MQEFIIIKRHPDFDILEDHIRQGKVKSLFLPKITGSCKYYAELVG